MKNGSSKKFSTIIPSDIDNGYSLFGTVNISSEYFEQFNPLSFPNGFLKPFRVEGKKFTRPYNQYTGDPFPLCCKQCREMYNQLIVLFRYFPNCCSLHQKSAQEPWFQYENYKNLPDKVIKCLFCTINFINENINNSNWFKNISYYIEYNIFSFGVPTIGAEWYLRFLSNSLLNFENVHLHSIPANKRLDLINHVFRVIQSSNTPQEYKDEKRKKLKKNFDLLVETYNKWLNYFPNLKYFKDFKKQAQEDFLEITSTDCIKNPFVPSIFLMKFRTQKELLKLLIELTKRTTSSINTKSLIENNSLSDDYKESLIDEKHRLRQMELYENFSKKEKKYVTHLRVWLENEKEYFTEKSAEIEKRKRKEKQAKSVARGKKKKPSSVADFFNGDQKKVEVFFSAISKIEDDSGLSVIDKYKKWLWQPDNSICNCLEALFQLSKEHGEYNLVNHSMEKRYSALFDMISSELNINCKKENFRKWNTNIDQIRIFKRKFRVFFREYLH